MKKESIIIDLSNGWNEKEVDKLLDNLSVDELSKSQMKEQSIILRKVEE